MMAESMSSPKFPLTPCESRRGSTNTGPPIPGTSIQGVDVGEQQDNRLFRQNKPSRAPYWLSRISGLRTSRAGNDLSADARYLTVQRALLLNAYPLAYIMLWLPDIVNRLIEATGHSSTVMKFLQVTSQLVGLANALTYGWNEGVERRLRERFSRRSIASNEA